MGFLGIAAVLFIFGENSQILLWNSQKLFSGPWPNEVFLHLKSIILMS